jgi:hypothetical protein
MAAAGLGGITKAVDVELATTEIREFFKMTSRRADARRNIHCRQVNGVFSMTYTRTPSAIALGV